MPWEARASQKRFRARLGDLQRLQRRVDVLTLNNDAWEFNDASDEDSFSEFDDDWEQPVKCTCSEEYRDVYQNGCDSNSSSQHCTNTYHRSSRQAVLHDIEHALQQESALLASLGANVRRFRSLVEQHTVEGRESLETARQSFLQSLASLASLKKASSALHSLARQLESLLRHQTTRARTLEERAKKVNETRLSCLRRIREPQWTRDAHFYMTATEHFRGRAQPHIFEVATSLPGKLRLSALAAHARQRRKQYEEEHACLRRDAEQLRLLRDMCLTRHKLRRRDVATLQGKLRVMRRRLRRQGLSAEDLMVPSTVGGDQRKLLTPLHMIQHVQTQTQSEEATRAAVQAIVQCTSFAALRDAAAAHGRLTPAVAAALAEDDGDEHSEMATRRRVESQVRTFRVALKSATSASDKKKEAWKFLESVLQLRERIKLVLDELRHSLLLLAPESPLNTTTETEPSDASDHVIENDLSGHATARKSKGNDTASITVAVRRSSLGCIDESPLVASPRPSSPRLLIGAA